MNLVADEGVDKAIVDALRAGGFCYAFGIAIHHCQRRDLGP